MIRDYEYFVNLRKMVHRGQMYYLIAKINSFGNIKHWATTDKLTFITPSIGLLSFTLTPTTPI